MTSASSSRNVVAFLSDVRQASGRIGPALRELDALMHAQESAERWRTRSQQLTGGRGAFGNPTASAALGNITELPERIAMVRGSLNEDIDTVGQGLALVAMVRRSLGGRPALAIELYYIDRAQTWAEVAREMHASDRTVHRWRDKALDYIEGIV